MDNIREILNKIKSQNLEEKINAIEESENIIAMIINSIVNELENDPNCYLIAERLSNVENILFTSLNNIYENTKKIEAKELSALLLFSIGSQNTINYLIRMIRSGSAHSGLAARDLAEKGVKEAVVPIIDRLTIIDIEEIDLIVTLIQALNKLNIPLPDNLKNRFKSNETPWQIRSLIEP